MPGTGQPRLLAQDALEHISHAVCAVAVAVGCPNIFLEACMTPTPMNGMGIVATALATAPSQKASTAVRRSTCAARSQQTTLELLEHGKGDGRVAENRPDEPLYKA